MAKAWAVVRRWEYFGVALVFHVVFAWSIFVVYFQSPVVHPGARYSVGSAGGAVPPARRAVLFVADGLRADTLFKAHPAAALPRWAQADITEAGARGTVYTGAYAGAFDRTNTLASAVNVDRAFVAPYLHTIATGRGRYGVSHTRVPTESRPGHVALLAGMYEDISAVTRGWKVNPIAFDSLLNQSSHAYAFGSPDIVPMFVLGTAPGQADMWTYKESEEDFTKDAAALDVWVLDQLAALLARASTDAALDAQLRAPQTFFFLHLLGLDTTGHTYRPHSPEYLGNTIVVDALVQKAEAMLEAFFNDNATAYVLTADHGMSARGNHGDGDPDNTRTPIVAWGAGVQAASNAAPHAPPTDAYYRDWLLDAYAQHDIEQADVTPLIASVLGLAVPANSQGTLPVAYLATSPAYLAYAAKANAQQLLEVYRVKHDERARRMATFTPYGPLGQPPGAQHLARIDAAIAQETYAHVFALCTALMEHAAAGAAYLHKYDAWMLTVVVVLAYVGILLYGATFLMHYALDTPVPAYRWSWGLVGVGGGLAAHWAYLVRNGAPAVYYLYSGACAVVWALATARAHVASASFAAAAKDATARRAAARIVVSLLLLLGVLQLTVVGYAHRITWACLLLSGILWPMSFPQSFREAHQPTQVVWACVSALCAAFMVASTDKEESVALLLLGGTLFFATGVLLYTQTPSLLADADYHGRDTQRDTPAEAPADFLRWTRRTLAVQLVLLLVSMHTTATSAWRLQRKQGVPYMGQVAGWAVLALALASPLLGFQRPLTVGGHTYRQPMRQRVVLLVFAFAPVFVLLSLRDEVCFFYVYTLLVLTWAHYEAELARYRALHTPNAPRTMGLEDVRVGVCYFLLLHIGFFGMGNVASISSFYLSPVYRLLPVFSPFWMAALLILKLVTPFVVLSSVLAALCAQPTDRRAHRIPLLASGLGLGDMPSPLTAAAIAGDVLALNFFFRIREEGSWLEIGQSITHFVMANLLQVYLVAIATLCASLIGAHGPRT